MQQLCNSETQKPLVVTMAHPGFKQITIKAIKNNKNTKGCSTHAYMENSKISSQKCSMLRELTRRKAYF